MPSKTKEKKKIKNSVHGDIVNKFSNKFFRNNKTGIFTNSSKEMNDLLLFSHVLNFSALSMFEISIR